MKTTIAALILVITTVVAGLAVRADSTIPEIVDPGTGVGEELILVVAGQFRDATGLRRASRNLVARFSDVQGFYRGRADDYAITGVHVRVGPNIAIRACTAECEEGRTTMTVLAPIQLRFVRKASFGTLPMSQRVRFKRGALLLLTAFRTKHGAEEFLDLGRTLGLNSLVTVSARKRGGGYVGLGQEPHPDGTGPLLGPLQNQTSYQR